MTTEKITVSITRSVRDEDGNLEEFGQVSAEASTKDEVPDLARRLLEGIST